MGRFLTPDPFSGSAHLGNPRTWNRYSYAAGDPINRTDANGLDPCPGDGEDFTCGPDNQYGEDAWIYADMGPGVVSTTVTEIPLGPHGVSTLLFNCQLGDVSCTNEGGSIVPNPAPPPGMVDISAGTFGFASLINGLIGAGANGVMNLFAASTTIAVDESTSLLSDTNFVYRGDSQSPATVFQNGFTAQGNSTDLLLHAIDNTNPPSAFVSTSTSFDQAANFSSNVYVIRAPSNGINVNSALGPLSPFPWENEVAVPFSISPSAVRGVTITNQGFSLINPNYGPFR
jgi:Pertussis toxin, subunit 1